MPSIRTVQAPHWPSPQPYLVPVRSVCSRRTESKVDCASASTGRFAPFTSRLEILAIKTSNCVVRERMGRLHSRLLFLTSAYTFGLHVADERKNADRGFSPLRKLTRPDAGGECF